MEIHPVVETNPLFMLLPFISGLIYLAIIVLIVYVVVKLLKFMKQKEAVDQEIISKLNKIIEKIESK